MKKEQNAGLQLRKVTFVDKTHVSEKFARIYWVKLCTSTNVHEPNKLFHI